MMPYRIWAFNYAGPMDNTQAFLTWLRGWEEPARRGYFFWCLTGEGPTVVIDAGVTPHTAGLKQLPNYKNPVHMLESVGESARRIEHLVLTHLHWDHCGGVSLFPNATVYVQEREYRFWTEAPQARRPALNWLKDDDALDHLARLAESGKLKLVKGDTELVPGVTGLSCPGHSADLMAVGVETARGRAVVGSDLAHTFDNYRQDWPGPIILDLPAWLDSMQKAMDWAGSPELVFPGHDVKMCTDYETVAPGVTRLA